MKAGLEFLAEERTRAEKPEAEKVISKAPAGCEPVQAAGMAAKPAGDAAGCATGMQDAPAAPIAKEEKKDEKKKSPDAWTTYCKILLSSNELLFID